MTDAELDEIIDKLKATDRLPAWIAFAIARAVRDATLEEAAKVADDHDNGWRIADSIRGLRGNG